MASLPFLLSSKLWAYLFIRFLRVYLSLSLSLTLSLSSVSQGAPPPLSFFYVPEFFFFFCEEERVLGASARETLRESVWLKRVLLEICQ